MDLLNVITLMSHSNLGGGGSCPKNVSHLMFFLEWKGDHWRKAGPDQEFLAPCADFNLALSRHLLHPPPPAQKITDNGLLAMEAPPPYIYAP